MARAGTVEPTCYGKAIDLLSRRGHFRLELETKLRRRDFEDSDIEATLTRLANEGLIDDRQSARQWTEEKLRQGPMGQRRLAHELRRRGVEAQTAHEVLTELLPEDDSEVAEQAAERWLLRRAGGRGEGSGDDRERERLVASLARHLERRGFSRRAIFGVLRRVREDWRDADPEPHVDDS